MNLRQIANDFRSFLDALKFAPGGEPRSFGKSLADFQRERFALIGPSIQALSRGETPPVTRFWIEGVKGSSKDSDAAAALVWLIAFSPREITAEVGARDQSQAGEMLRAIRSIVRLNPWLASFIELQAASVLNLRTGSRGDFLSSDAPGAHGSRPHVTIINEATHHVDSEFAQTLADNAAKVPENVLFILTNAGTRPSWQWTWREIAFASDRWATHVVNELPPWIDPAEIAEAAKRSSRERVGRLWRGEWSASSGGALSEDVLSRAVTLAGPAYAAEKNWATFAGIDFGYKRDGAAIVVVAKDLGEYEEPALPQPRPRSRLGAILADLGEVDDIASDYLHENASAIWTPGSDRIRLCVTYLFRPQGARGTVDVEAFEKTLFALHDTFRFSALADPWELRLKIREWRMRGISVNELPFTPPNIAAATQALLESFNTNRIDLFDCADLMRDLRAAQVEAKSWGERLSFPKDSFGHGDVGTAFMLAILAASRSGSANAGTIAGPLTVWPN